MPSHSPAQPCMPSHSPAQHLLTTCAPPAVKLLLLLMLMLPQMPTKPRTAQSNPVKELVKVRSQTRLSSSSQGSHPQDSLQDQTRPGTWMATWAYATWARRPPRGVKPSQAKSSQVQPSPFRGAASLNQPAAQAMPACLLPHTAAACPLPHTPACSVPTPIVPPQPEPRLACGTRPSPVQPNQVKSSQVEPPIVRLRPEPPLACGGHVRGSHMVHATSQLHVHALWCIN